MIIAIADIQRGICYFIVSYFYVFSKRGKTSRDCNASIKYAGIMHDADRDGKAYSCTRYPMEQVVDIIDNF
jgi:hypothetical protein